MTVADVYIDCDTLVVFESLDNKKVSFFSRKKFQFCEKNLLNDMQFFVKMRNFHFFVKISHFLMIFVTYLNE